MTSQSHKYQLGFFNVSEGAEPIKGPLVASLESSISMLGLDPVSDILWFDQEDLSAVDPRFPTACVFFGWTPAAGPAREAVAKILAAGIRVVPVVPVLRDYKSAVPECLWEINGTEPRPSDPKQICLSELLLEELRLLREKRLAFISYRRSASSGVAEQLYRELDDRSYDVFLDTHSVLPGRVFQSVLWDQLADADVLVLLNTPDAFSSAWVEQEVTRAQNLGLGVLQVVWPNHLPDAATELCEPLYLEQGMLDGGPGCQAVLRSDAVTAVLNAIERLRARSLASRRARIVSTFLEEARDHSVPTVLQSEGWLEVSHPRLGEVRLLPVVGHPPSHVLHRTHAGCLAATPPRKACVLFDDLGLAREKAEHFRWLNDFLPVNALAMSEIGRWLGTAA